MWRILAWDFKRTWVCAALFMAILCAACSTKNQAEPYSKPTAEEEAKIALDAHEFDKAITAYEEILGVESERYDLVPLLSAAYAGRAGIDILSLMKNSLSSGGETDVLSQVASFVPALPSADQVSDTRLAVQRLDAMPADHRDEANTTYSYASSASLQLVLYATAAATMTLNQLQATTTAGSYDAQKLQDMTDEQVDTIISSLTTAGNAGNSGVSGAASDGAREVLAKVEEQPGATTREKLINYLQTKNP